MDRSSSEPQRPSVLVVEDDPDLRRHLSFVLNDAGFWCIQTANENEALDALSPGKGTEQIRAIVADIDLSEADGDARGGIVLAETLAQMHQHIPVILISYDPSNFLPLRESPELDGPVNRLSVRAMLDRNSDAFNQKLVQCVQQAVGGDGGARKSSMNVNAVLVDDLPDNFRGMLRPLSTVEEISFDDQVVNSTFHTLAPVLLPDDKLDVKTTVARISDLHPAVAFVDMRLEGDDPGDFSGVDLSLSLKTACPDCCIILVSSHFDSAPELTRHLEVFRYWVNRLQPAELYGKDLRQRYEEALKTYLSNVKYRHLVGSTHAASGRSKPHSRHAVYISYAWGDKLETGPSREEIVDRLDTSLLAGGYDVRRDKRNLPFKASISEFMKELGRAGCVVVVLSHKYLRSRHCMNELVELYRNRNFRKRIFPIVLPDAAIATFHERAEYVKYWGEELRQLEEAILKVARLPSNASFSELCIYREINENVGALLEFIAKMKYWTLSGVETDDCASLKQSINERLRELDA